jgi:hypothetical protein
MSIVKEHGGAYAQGVEYAYTMVHGGAYAQGVEYAYTMVHGAPASRQQSRLPQAA